MRCRSTASCFFLVYRIFCYVVLVVQIHALVLGENNRILFLLIGLYSVKAHVFPSRAPAAFACLLALRANLLADNVPGCLMKVILVGICCCCVMGVIADVPLSKHASCQVFFSIFSNIKHVTPTSKQRKNRLYFTYCHLATGRTYWSGLYCVEL